MPHEVAPIHQRDSFETSLERMTGRPENRTEIVTNAITLGGLELGFLNDPRFMIGRKLLIIKEVGKEDQATKIVCVELYLNRFTATTYVRPGPVAKELERRKSEILDQDAEPDLVQDILDTTSNRSDDLLLRVGEIKEEQAAREERARHLLEADLDSVNNGLSNLGRDDQDAERVLAAFFNDQFE